MDSIRAKGFRVAIDDFGVAYANIMTLARLGFDELKLDKSLMDDLCGSDKRQRLLRLVIEAAEDMGIRTVAEGVETEEQLAVLRNWAVPGPRAICSAGRSRWNSSPPCCPDRDRKKAARKGRLFYGLQPVERPGRATAKYPRGGALLRG